LVSGVGTLQVGAVEAKTIVIFGFTYDSNLLEIEAV
jgi:hypothetical protein